MSAEILRRGAERARRLGTAPSLLGSDYDDPKHIAVASLLSLAAEQWHEDDECRSPVGPDESCGACDNCDRRWMRDRLLAVARAYLGESA